MVMGRLDDAGRVGLALETVATLVSRGHKLPLTVIGEGRRRDALQQQARRLGVAELVRFVGAMPPDQALGYLARADLMLLTTQGELLSRSGPGGAYLRRTGGGLLGQRRSGGRGASIRGRPVESAGSGCSGGVRTQLARRSRRPGRQPFGWRGLAHQAGAGSRGSGVRGVVPRCPREIAAFGSLPSLTTILALPAILPAPLPRGWPREWPRVATRFRSSRRMRRDCEVGEEVGGVTLHRFRYAPEGFERVAYTGGLHQGTLRSPLAALFFPGFLLAFEIAVRQAARTFRPHVVHAHWWFPGGWFTSHTGLPYLITCHGSDVRLLERGAPVRSTARKVLERAARVTTVSRFLAQDIRRLLPDLKAEPVVTPMPLDVDAVSIGRAATRRRFLPGFSMRGICCPARAWTCCSKLRPHSRDVACNMS